jgi:hypothetical protein
MALPMLPRPMKPMSWAPPAVDRGRAGEWEHVRRPVGAPGTNRAAVRPMAAYLRIFAACCAEAQLENPSALF